MANSEGGLVNCYCLQKLSHSLCYVMEAVVFHQLYNRKTLQGVGREGQKVAKIALFNV